MTSVPPSTVALEVLWTQFESMTSEMEATLVRTAFSSGIREAGDCSCALFDAEGRMISQASTAPGQMGSMPYLMAEFLRRVPAAEILDGDVFITNDPWLGCGHTPDIYCITPIFSSGELIAYAANSGHHADLGGRLGSQESREVYEEGILIPLCHLYMQGRENRELVALLRMNSRLPDELVGDLRAQMAANHVARERVMRLSRVHRLGREDIVRITSEIIGRSSRAMRSRLFRSASFRVRCCWMTSTPMATGWNCECRCAVEVIGSRSISRAPPSRSRSRSTACSTTAEPMYSSD